MLLVASPVLAADQGSLGTTSKGEVVISVTVASRAALSEPATPAAGGDAPRACLWLDTATRGYAVAALDAPIAWHPSATSPAGLLIAPGTVSAALSSAAARPDCDRDPSLFVAYARADGRSSRPATLLIAPE